MRKVESGRMSLTLSNIRRSMILERDRRILIQIPVGLVAHNRLQSDPFCVYNTNISSKQI